MLKLVLKMHKLYKNTIPKQVMFGVFYAIVVLKYLQIKKFKYNSLEFFFHICLSIHLFVGSVGDSAKRFQCLEVLYYHTKPVSYVVENPGTWLLNCAVYTSSYIDNTHQIWSIYSGLF